MRLLLGQITCIVVSLLAVAGAQSLPNGLYQGKALNSTAKKSGRITLDIISTGSSGKVQAYLSAYDGLIGDGSLTGTVDANGKLQLSGNLSGWKMEVAGQVSGKQISANYELTGLGSPQRGEFTVEHAFAGPSVAAKSIAEIVGTWKKGDAFVPTLDPVTHIPQGSSFSDGGTLEISSDGHFSYGHVHNHCDRFGANCCRIDNENWQGTVSIDDGLSFHIASGTQSHHDSCMAAMNKTWTLSPHTVTYDWQMKSARVLGAGTAPELCWNNAGNWTCYTRSAK